MAHNRIPLVIPCHRVVDSQGRYGGFSAPGGVEMKLRLLALEGTEVPETDTQQQSGPCKKNNKIQIGQYQVKQQTESGNFAIVRGAPIVFGQSREKWF